MKKLFIALLAFVAGLIFLIDMYPVREEKFYVESNQSVTEFKEGLLVSASEEIEITDEQVPLGIDKEVTANQPLGEYLALDAYMSIEEITVREGLLSDSLSKVYTDVVETGDWSMINQLAPLDVYRIYLQARLDEKYEIISGLTELPRSLTPNAYRTLIVENNSFKEETQKKVSDFLNNAYRVFLVVLSENEAQVFVNQAPCFKIIYNTNENWRILFQE